MRRDSVGRGSLMKKTTQQEINEWEKLILRFKALQNCKLVNLRIKERILFNPLDVTEDIAYPIRITKAIEKEKRCQPAPVKPSKTTWITIGIQRLKNRITQIVQNM
jgi:hypothetical protein